MTLIDEYDITYVLTIENKLLSCKILKSCTPQSEPQPYIGVTSQPATQTKFWRFSHSPSSNQILKSHPDSYRISKTRLNLRVRVSQCTRAWVYNSCMKSAIVYIDVSTCRFAHIIDISIPIGFIRAKEIPRTHIWIQLSPWIFQILVIINN